MRIYMTTTLKIVLSQLRRLAKAKLKILNAIIFQTYGLNVVDEARSYLEGKHEHAQSHFAPFRRTE